MEAVIAASIFNPGEEEVFLPEAYGARVVDGVAEEGHVFRFEDGILGMSFQEFQFHEFHLTKSRVDSRNLKCFLMQSN